MNDQKLDAFIERAKQLPWTDENFYANFMAQVHFFTSHSVQMLHAAAAVTEDRKYASALTKHTQAETGHDRIALKDVERLGFLMDEFQELGVTRAMWECQLFKAQRCPEALLGYIYALEKAAVEIYGHILPAITKAFGKEAVRFIALHAAEDREHVEIQRAQIVALPETEKREALINVDQTAELLESLVDGVLTATAEMKRRSVHSVSA